MGSMVMTASRPVAASAAVAALATPSMVTSATSIEPGDVMACGGEVGGHGPAHVAEADKSDVHGVVLRQNVSSKPPSGASMVSTASDGKLLAS